ncbi:MAG: aldo/keto reductase [Gammaproteobacteria bacterium]
MNKRLALGTVQLGVPYGVANQQGQVPREEAAAIVAHARLAGLDTLDTAIAYGTSESRLGEIGVGEWRVVSKLPPLPADCPDVVEWVGEQVRGSLSRLGITRLHGLLLHRAQDLLESRGEELALALRVVKDSGQVGKTGVSVYGPDELAALGPGAPLELVQAPFNVLDRRMATSGWLARLHARGVEVHTRSAFLQGLLLMSASDRPATFKRWQTLWDHWHGWLDEHALSPVAACLAFALAQPEIDRVIVGVDSLAQLKEILGHAGERTATPPATLSSEEPLLINPSLWKPS